MRNSKIVKIDDVEITLKELRVRDIYMLFAGDEGGDADDSDSMLERLDMFLKYCSDITRDVLMDMAPSDIEKLLAGFMEVNQAFFNLAGKIGLNDVPALIKDSLQEQLTLSLQQGMGQ